MIHLLFRAMGDRVRLMLLELIIQAGGTLTVGELLACLNEELDKNHRIKQPTLSHHLNCLREAGLINAAEHGRCHYYQANMIALESCYQQIKQLKKTA